MNLNSTESSDIRKFGIIALIFFGCLCALGIWTGKGIPTYLFGLLSMLGVGFILIPGKLRPLYSGWLKTAHFIGKVITMGVLTLAYYLVITPSALLKRIFGGAPLPTRPRKGVDSYWVPRNEKAQPRERFLKRY